MSLLLMITLAGVSIARPSTSSGGRASWVSPAPVLPLSGARVDERGARFEIAPGAAGIELRIVVAKFRFDPSGWSTLPDGPAWTIVPCGTEPIALEPLGLADRTDTPLWWAVVWKDPRSGALRASEVRSFTLVPRFANRAASRGELRPSAQGRLGVASVAPATGPSPRRVIELAAGQALSPAEMPSLPSAASRRESEPPTGAGGAREAYLVQFADDSPDSARARIASAGGALVWPVSGNAYIVRIDAEGLDRLQHANGQPWVATYEPAYKLSRALTDSAAGSAQVTALLFEDGDAEATLAALRALGAAKVEGHRSRWNQLVRFELDRSRMAEVAAIPDVAWVEPAPRFTFSNDQAQWVVQSGVQDQRPVTDHGLRGQGQVVMTSDSGIRPNHEMFNDSTLAIDTWGDFPTHRKIIAYKRGANSPLVTFGDAVQFDYHGTHTAGTVAGDPSPSSAAPWGGIAKDARLYFMDVAGTDGEGLRLPEDLNELYEPSYIGNAGGAARISSNSWGGFSQSAYTLSSMQTDQFVWNHPDYLIAFASGNVGTFAAVTQPATAKNCLTVGATGNGTDLRHMANFSSRGPVKDGRRKPNVVAPGELVTSSIGSTRYTYASYSGTSMATPAVAGAMALVRQYLTEGWYPTGAPVAANALVPSAALLRAMAVAAARNDVTGFRAPDNTIGYGRLTIDDVLYFPGDSLRTLLVDTGDGLSDQQFTEYQVQVTDPSQPLKIALCWTDAPGSPASAAQIVNDLDLVVSHDGSSYRGNALLNNISVSGGPRDSLNVEEFVRLPTPTPGVYTVRIEGRRIVQGPQRFALCVTGGVGGPTGAVALDRFQYGLEDTLAIELMDTDATGPVTAMVSSGTEPGPESVVLTGSHGVFRGSIVLGPVLAQHGDGVLAVTSGDVVSVRYSGDTPALDLTATARIHVQSAVISNVHANPLGPTHVVVTWTTDLSASSSLRFGTTGALSAIADSAGFTKSHAVLLTGLTPGTTYRYDVESATPAGHASRDSLDGAHRSFTTRPAGTIALLMDDPDPTVLATWNNAFASLGWDVDVYPAAANDPPLVGNRDVGLRHYDAVLWQVGPDNYPPFSDAQRAAIDSLLDGGGRLLVTGHDIGFGLADAGAPSYTAERELWLERTLKSRYYIDNIYADTLTGVPGSPVSGSFTDSLYYTYYLYPDSGDNFGPAPGMDGVWSGDWTDNFVKSKYMGMHWESDGPRGTPGSGVWGGQTSRIVGMFYEWRALESNSTAHRPQRTAVLQDAVAWLMGHRPPEVRINSPVPGRVVTNDFLPVWFSLRPDSGRTITSRALDFSLDGGESWAAAAVAVWNDSMCVWDLAAALGGIPPENATRVRLRLRVSDDGSPPLQATALVPGTITLARQGFDKRGPALVAGGVSCSSVPLRRDREATLFATFSDAETGGGTVAGAEYSVGAAPAPAGGGTPMTGTFGLATVQAAASLATADVESGTRTFWVRARDSANRWGVASALSVPTSGSSTLGVDDEVAVDFLGHATPNPFRGHAALRFGLARAGDVKLELFDVAGRSVRTLASGKLSPGVHVSVWDGRDREGNAVKAGVYFVRLQTPTRTFHARVVALN